MDLARIQHDEAIGVEFSDYKRELTGFRHPPFPIYDVPSGIMRIYVAAFHNTKVERVTLPESMLMLSENAFYMCSELKFINFPSNLRIIEDGCFTGCGSLTDICLPDSLNYLGGGAFEDCNGLLSIDTYAPQKTPTLNPSPMKRFLDNLKRLMHFGGKGDYTPSGTIQMPDHGIGLGPHAFANCSQLLSVKLPTKFTSIPYGAFRHCGELRNVILHEGITEIGDFAFEDCSSLETLQLPESLLRIGSRAFRNCRSLKIHIPESVKEIGEAAFEGTEIAGLDD